MKQTLYAVPQVYDALHSGFAEDIPFYTELASRQGLIPSSGAAAPVCELACGTGRVTIPLAEAGATVVGVDLSPEMLRSAELHRLRAGIPDGQITFLQGDMRSPPAQGGPFGLTIIPLHSLSHLLETADVRRCLEGIHRGLTADGRLALAVHNPDPLILGRDTEELEPIHAEIAQLTVYETGRYERDRQLLHLAWYVEGAEETERYEYTLRMFFPEELLLLLEVSGFVVEERYGWYDRSPFTADSGTQILVARKR